jgi:hypothetical protein
MKSNRNGLPSLLRFAPNRATSSRRTADDPMLNVQRVVTPATIPYTVVGRADLRHKILCAERELESLRISELTLRETLATKLHVLGFHASTSSFRIRTNQYRDGHACLDAHIAQARTAETALIEHLAEIRRMEIDLEDMRRTHDDDALWMEL